ncbi:MAG: PadR family transcriptional regulator [Microbacteriaceae bacterium]|nr:PadR family transcriptional regulator [Microbacteriaceae bacterium]MCL2795826.1 PadR family transcriptional regulator [Microbacteriaceae bacterium]
MSVRNSLLAILTLGPCYGSQLKAEFERRTGGSWSLNVGQVYTTLARLERDRLVERLEPDPHGRELFATTDAGRAAVLAWFRSPVSAGGAQRDELTMKVLVALTLPGADVPGILDAQREALVPTAPEPGVPFARLLALEAQDAHTAAQRAWLDAVDHRRGEAPEPYGLSPDLPKRGRPQRGA